METTQMTAREAIDAMEAAIKAGDKRKVFELFASDNSDNLPDWDEEPDFLWEEWQELIEKAEQILGL